MKKFKISHVFIYLLLILLTLICVVPFYIMVINATHSTNELYAGLSVVPGKYLLDNLRNMLSMVNMPRGFLNSAIVSFSSTFLSIYFGAMTAFGLFERRPTTRPGPWSAASPPSSAPRRTTPARTGTL